MFTAKDLKPEDADQAASIHDRAFKSFFLTSLGTKFLIRFYKALTKRNDTVCKGYWDNKSKLTGFIVANYNHTGFYRDLCISNFYSFFSATFLIFLRNPKMLLRLVQSFRSNRQLHGLEEYPYLLSICVDPNLHGKGLGTLMINDLIETLGRKGQTGLYLTTDSEGNNSANSFYIRTGFQKKATFYQGKRKMNVYFKDFARTSDVQKASTI